MVSIFFLAKQYDARVLEAVAGSFIKKNTKNYAASLVISLVSLKLLKFDLGIKNPTLMSSLTLKKLSFF